MEQHHEETLILGTFLLDGLEFGVDILKQREVIRMMPVTRMPCATEFVEGVIHFRDTLIPIVNLRTRFGMPRKELGKSTRILNIEVADDLVVGFIVDEVGQMRRVDRGMIEPPPAVVAPVEAEYISGVCKFGDRLLFVLDLARILSDGDLEGLDEGLGGLPDRPGEGGLFQTSPA